MATQEHLINYVQAQFPTAARAHIRAYLNLAAEQMSEESLVMRSAVTVTLDGVATQYALAANILRVDRVTWGVETVRRLLVPPEAQCGDGSEYGYRIDAGNLHIGYLGTKTLNPLAAGTVLLHCRVKADDLSQFLRLYDSAGNAIIDAEGNDLYVVGDELQEGSGLPSFVHLGLSHFALRELHLAAGNMGISDRYDRLFKQAVQRARKHANQNQNTHAEIISYRF